MDDPAHGHQTYLLTCDLGKKVETFRHLGIKTPDPNGSFFSELQDELKTALQKSLPSNVVVKEIDITTLADDILGEAYTHKGIQDGSLIVSSCAELADPMKGMTLEINRLVNFDGVSIGLGPRPGYPPINDQLARISKVASGRPIILIEDGMWSGTTMRFIIEQFKISKLNIQTIIVGFMFPEATEIVEWIESEGIKVVSIREFDNLYDWVPDHDFFPFVPNCGRVVGVDTPIGPQPYYDHNGTTYSVPYFRPFSPMDKWASIPPENMSKLSLTCFALCSKLLFKLAQMNEYDILVREITKGANKASMPHLIGRGGIADPNQSLKSILHDIEHNVAVFELRG